MSIYHNEEYSQVIKELNTSESGLTRDEAKKRLKKSGLNELPKEKPVSKSKIFFSQFNNALVYILIFAGVFSFVLNAYVDSGVIFTAIILNVIIGYFQENKANEAIKKLKNLVEHNAYVIRDNHEKSIKSSFITKGDIIVLKAGNRIPADARLIEAIDLQVNEASLTGESLPSNKNVEPVLKGAALADRDSMVYASTVVVQGKGKAVITGIGIDTEIGKIAQLVHEAKEEKTPLQLRLEEFSRFLGIGFSLVCIFIVIVGVLQGRDILEMLEVGVAVGVASIPEGLTVAVTFILALGMQRILRRKALTKKLVAAETLGSVTTICTDKTGTLTEGRMHVDHIIIGENEFAFSNIGSRQNEKDAKIVSLALQVSMMCNDAVIENPLEALDSWRIIGSPTEVALLSAATQSGLRQGELLKVEPQIAEMPFSSEKKYMLSLHKRADKDYVLYEKGAPEKLLEKSKKYYHEGKICNLDEIALTNLSKTYEKLTNKGLRVVSVAIREIKDELDEQNINLKILDQDLTFIGFIAIKDPLRREAKETIKYCREAGIRPVIITGDHKLTAKAIALEVGMRVGPDNILTGEELDQISDKDLSKMIKKIDVYARVSPHHKLRIVKILQDKGEVVAMTGDGINDSPALKAADIGISLGTGTDIAKETSDLVLLDSNFKTIVAAIKEGRVIFQNIRKVITFLLSDSFSEVILITGSITLGAVLFGEDLPLAILPAQILWINIVNDSFPHFSLAFEKGSENVMKDRPLKKDEPLLNNEMKLIIFAIGTIRNIIIFSIYLYLYVNRENLAIDISYIRTIVFVMIGFDSLMYIFSLKDLTKPIWKINLLSNRYLLFSVAVSLSLMVVAVYLPPLQNILGLSTDKLLGIDAWSLILMNGVLSVVLVEAVKYKFLVKKIS